MERGCEQCGEASDAGDVICRRCGHFLGTPADAAYATAGSLFDLLTDSAAVASLTEPIDVPADAVPTVAVPATDAAEPAPPVPTPPVPTRSASEPTTEPTTGSTPPTTEPTTRPTSGPAPHRPSPHPRARPAPHRRPPPLPRPDRTQPPPPPPGTQPAFLPPPPLAPPGRTQPPPPPAGAQPAFLPPPPFAPPAPAPMAWSQRQRLLTPPSSRTPTTIRPIIPVVVFVIFVLGAILLTRSPTTKTATGTSAADNPTNHVTDPAPASLPATSFRTEWHASLTARPTSDTPLVVDSAVIVANGSALVAFDRRNGQPLWTAPLPGDALPNVAAAGDIVVTATNGGQVIAFDVTSGAERWRWSASEPIRQPLVATTASVYVAGTHLSAIDAHAGTTRWFTTTTSAPRASSGRATAGGYEVPAVDSARGLLAVARDGSVEVLRTDNGALVYNAAAGELAATTPVASAGMFWFDTSGSDVLAVSGSTKTTVKVRGKRGAARLLAADGFGGVVVALPTGAVGGVSTDQSSLQWTATGAPVAPGGVPAGDSVLVADATTVRAVQPTSGYVSGSATVPDARLLSLGQPALHNQVALVVADASGRRFELQLVTLATTPNGTRKSVLALAG